jgi:aminopeptidase N
VIHRNISEMRGVLNRFVYQKGGWVLHMLRGVMGTERFWAGIREYYRRYRDSNASTDDFRLVMEQTSGLELSWFFDQWLRQPGVAKLTGTWDYDPVARRVTVELSQLQPGQPYRLPLEIGLTGAGRPMRVERVELTGASGQSAISVDSEPVTVLLDPNTWTLMDSDGGSNVYEETVETGDQRSLSGQPEVSPEAE